MSNYIYIDINCATINIYIFRLNLRLPTVYIVATNASSPSSEHAVSVMEVNEQTHVPLY